MRVFIDNGDFMWPVVLEIRKEYTPANELFDIIANSFGCQMKYRTTCGQSLRGLLLPHLLLRVRLSSRVEGRTQRRDDGLEDRRW